MGYINEDPHGVGEQILYTERENEYRRRNLARGQVNEQAIWGLVGHMEYAGLNSPGDAAVGLGMAYSGLIPGSPEANEIIFRAESEKWASGAEWDADPNATISGLNRNDLVDFSRDINQFTKENNLINIHEGKSRAELEASPNWDSLSEDQKAQSIAYNEALTQQWEEAVGAATPEEEPTTLWGGIKGAGRNLMFAWDIVRDSADSVARALEANKQNALVPAGTGEHSSFSPTAMNYLSDFFSGERINQGEGLLSGGDFSDDVTDGLGRYYETTENLTQADFDSMKARQGGRVMVTGMNGQQLEARSLEELKWLRHNTGITGHLQSLVAASPQQAALGIPHSKLNEEFYRRNMVATDKTGSYYTVGLGKSFMAEVLGMESTNSMQKSSLTDSQALFDLGSHALDLTKNVAEMGFIRGTTGELRTILGRGHNATVGVGGEGAEQIRATATANSIVGGADADGVAEAINDLAAGTINRQHAVNAVGRPYDAALDNAKNTVNRTKEHANHSSNQRHVEEVQAHMERYDVDLDEAIQNVKPPMSEGQVNSLIRRAQNGDMAAGSWVANQLKAVNDDPLVALDELENFHKVSDRADVSLIDGKFGAPDIDADLLRQIEDDVDSLTDMLGSGRGSVLKDPENPNKIIVTYDADLGRAQQTFEKLAVDQAAKKGSRVGAARRVVNAFDEWTETVAARNAEFKKSKEIERAARKRGAAKLDELVTHPTADGVEAQWHGARAGGDVEDFLSLEDAHKAGAGDPTMNLHGPGLYATDNHRMAGAFAKGGGGVGGRGIEKGNLYHLTWMGDGEPRILDMNQQVWDQQVAGRLFDALDEASKLGNDSWDAIFKGQVDDLKAAFYDVAINGRADFTNDLMAMTQNQAGFAGSRIADIITSIHQMGFGEIDNLADFQFAFNKALSNHYDMMRHTLGSGSKGKDVTIWLRPDKLQPTRVTDDVYTNVTDKYHPSTSRVAAEEAAVARSGDTNLELARIFDETIEGGVLDDLLNAGDLKHTDRIKDMDKLRRLAATSDSQLEGVQSALAKNVFNDMHLTRQWGQRVLGDSHEAADEYDNMVRVVKRHDEAGDLLHGVSDFNRKIDPSRIRNMFMGTDGAIHAVVNQLAEAKTHKEVRDLLRPTNKLLGGAGVSSRFVFGVINANTAEEVIDVFIKVNDGTMIVPPKITALGNAARYTNALSTFGGTIAGGVFGFDQQVQAEGTLADQIGGAIAGGVLGGLGGSAISGAGLGVFNKLGNVPVLNRSIDDFADGLDLLLAGTRAETAEFLQLTSKVRGGGVRMGKPMPELGISQQLGAAMGHLAWGRRIARHAPSDWDLNDPEATYQNMWGWAQNVGMAGDEQIINLRRRVVDYDDLGNQVVSWEGQKLLSSQFDSQESFEAAARRLEADGYDMVDHVKMDNVFSELAQMQANNPGRGWVALHELGKVVDGFLADAGMSKENRELLTRFATDGQKDFIRNVDAVGHGANHAQFNINGSVTSGLDDGYLLTSELWSGKVSLPAPRQVYRAMDQTNTFGVIRQSFTGAGIWSPFKTGEEGAKARGSVWEEIGKISDPETAASFRAAFTPTLEHNVAVRSARLAVMAVTTPLVLLTRFVSFASRVLGEDQARMMAADLDSVLRHPANLMGAALANFDFMKRRGAMRGVAARSIIPDELIDARTGRINSDQLDGMSEWDQAEQIKSELRVYDRDGEANRRVFGHRQWDEINRVQNPTQWKGGVATELRQVIADPMMRALARSTSTDAPRDVLRWLTTTPDGQDVMQTWRQQFRTPQEAAEAMSGDRLLAFLQDAEARLHLKTGGDYIYRAPGQTTLKPTPNIHPLANDADEVVAKGWDQLDEGYHITRKGDDELLNVLKTGEIDGLKLDGGITDEVWNRIKQLVDDTDARFEKNLANTPADQLDSAHRFPATVKGEITTPIKAGERADVWTTMLDNMYDVILGWPSQVFSRQPVLGNYYWERVGMLLPMMDRRTRDAFKQLAFREGSLIPGRRSSTWNRVESIGEAFAGRGMGTDTLTDFKSVEANAKAYAVERLNNTLFDLNRQRNFIDSTRLLYPFVGPMVEAFENWGRIIQRRPAEVWRRGSQVVRELWNQSPLTADSESFNLGMFHTDPETGDEMVRVPFSGQFTEWWSQTADVLPWVSEEEAAGIPTGPIDMRARGFNVVFGTEDLTAGEQPEFMGVPLPALDPGGSFVVQAPVHMLTKDREGIAREINEFVFPFGTPETITESVMPYHLRLIKQGLSGDMGNRQYSQHVEKQWETMIARGEAGVGSDYDYNLEEDGEIREALDVAEERARGAQLYEGFTRGVLPTMTTPQAWMEVQELQADGVDMTRLIKISALSDMARELMTEEGAEWLSTPDGYRVSTEGDSEVTTDYLNKMFNTNIFDVDFLDLPTSDSFYPAHYTEPGRAWTARRESIVDDLPASAHLLMPNYAQVKEEEEYSFEAREAAIERGDIDYFTNMTEIEIELESMLLTSAFDGINREADRRFGPDDSLTGEENQKKRDLKGKFLAIEKDRATARFRRGSIDESQIQVVRDELRSWEIKDFEGEGLDPEEMATVEAVKWYWELYRHYENKALGRGMNNLTDKGQTSEDQLYMDMLRSEVDQFVQMQVRLAAEAGHSMGNFVYIYDLYLASEFNRVEEFDPLQALDMVRQGYWQIIPEENRPENYLGGFDGN